MAFVKSRVNGLILNHTASTQEVVKQGNGQFAFVISKERAEAQEVQDETKSNAPKKLTAKQKKEQEEAEKVIAEAKKKGITLTPEQVKAGDENLGSIEQDDAVEKL